MLRRRLNSGSFLTTQKDVEARKAPTPLWKRKLVAGLLSFAALSETVAAVLGTRDRVFTWVWVVWFWALAAWFIWQVSHPLTAKAPEATLLAVRSEDSSIEQ
jgi:hypothetical protein